MKNLLAHLLSLLVTTTGLLACDCIDEEPLTHIDQLEGYDYIAHVRFISDSTYITQENLGPIEEGGEPFLYDVEVGVLGFQEIEQFKGQKPEFIHDFLRNSSCDLGFGVGEEWILFGSRFEEKMVVGACGFSQQYRAVSGLRDWKYGDGIGVLETLKRLYNKPQIYYPDGPFSIFYPSGQIEVEGTGKGGKLHGKRTIWYPDSVMYGQQNYLNGELDGQSRWYYPSGQIAREDHFCKGTECNISQIWHDTAQIAFYHRVYGSLIDSDFDKGDSCNPHVHYRRVYNDKGDVISEEVYSEGGAIEEKSFSDQKTGRETRLTYFPNGKVSSIQVLDENRKVESKVEFNEDGTLDAN